MSNTRIGKDGNVVEFACYRSNGSVTPKIYTEIEYKKKFAEFYPETDK